MHRAKTRSRVVPERAAEARAVVPAGPAHPEARLAVVVARAEELEGVRRVGPEELRVAPEELRVAPEELRVAPEELRVGPEELRVAPEELRVAPEELPVGAAAQRAAAEERGELRSPRTACSCGWTPPIRHSRLAP